MKKSLLAVSVSLSLLLITGGVHAANVKAGQEKSASCVVCHGDKGNSLVSTYPKLASQNEEYLAQQLHAFKTGKRNGPMMSAIVASLSDEDIEDIATFYEAQTISHNVLPPLEIEEVEEDDSQELSDEQRVELKEKAIADKQAAQEQQDAMIAMGYDIYRNGDLENEISACIACHGPKGEGNKPALFPALNSQHADYLIKTLHDFKQDKRSNIEGNMMHMIARRMSEAEIKATAYYISTLK